MLVRSAEPGDFDGMQQLASRVWPSGWHPGGLGWGLSRHALADSLVVALDQDGSGPIVGFAGRGGDEITHVERDRDDVAGRDDPRRHVDGYTIRPVRTDETAARVEVHRAAWRPSSIPYIDGRPVDPDAESSFTPAAYESVCNAWLYDPGLDLVAVVESDHSGRFGACCIAWFDPATGVCEIEPLGVDPEHRRRGLAVALCLEVAHLVADRGGTHVYINAQPEPGYVAATSAYFSAGFDLVERATTYATPGHQ